jgi:hypothetical protein
MIVDHTLNIRFENRDPSCFIDHDTAQREIRNWLGDPGLHLTNLAYVCDFCQKDFKQNELKNIKCLECDTHYDRCVFCRENQNCPFCKRTCILRIHVDKAL